MNTTRKVIAGLVLLVAVAVVVDFVAAAYSEYRVSRSLRAGAELSADPEVIFHGFPFVAQALRGDYRTVEIRARAVRPDIPGEIRVEATLEGVHLSPRDLIDGRVRSVSVDRVSGRMRIEPVELGRLFKIPDLQVASRPADKSDGTGGSGGSGMTTTTNGLILTGTIPAGPDIATANKVSVQADLRLDGDQISIAATDLYHGRDTAALNEPTGDDSAPDQSAVLARFTRTIDTRDLPFDVHPTTVQAQGGQIVVSGEGENVTIDMDQFARP